MMCDGVLAGELDDVLGEVGLDPLDAGVGQRVRQADLLAEHRLRAGRTAWRRPSRQIRTTMRAGLVVGARPVDLGAGGDGVALERLEIVVEVGDHVVLDRLAARARRLELGEGGHGGGALALGGAGGAVDRHLERARRRAPRRRAP